MTYHADAFATLPNLPKWVTAKRAETSEIVAFRSGAAFVLLDCLISNPSTPFPVRLLARHLSFMAAVQTSKLEGRNARPADLRDAFFTTPPGENRGPDGDLVAFWYDATRAGPADHSAQSVGPELQDWFEAARKTTASHGPIPACAQVMQRVLAADNRAERLACLCADQIIAQAFGWQRILPMSAQRMTKTMLRGLANGDRGADLAVQAGIVEAIIDTVRLARDIDQRANALRAVAPKLRSKGSDAAVALFLTEPVVSSATMLSPVIQGTRIAMTDRSARRFCDRLVSLGVARELTGRATFRLYGITG